MSYSFEHASRLTVLAGHYGSGKTLLALNYAMALRERHENVTLADLDIVNPYYRTQDHRARLEERGIRLIVSQFAGSNAELPGFPPEVAAVFDDDSRYAVLDIGGDDRGALALGRYAEKLNGSPPAAVWMVLNAYRPLTRHPEQAIEILREIEAACRVRFTGLINNSHRGEETSVQDVTATMAYANEVSERSGLPLVFTSARQAIAHELPPESGAVFPLRVFAQSLWQTDQS